MLINDLVKDSNYCNIDTDFVDRIFITLQYRDIISTIYSNLNNEFIFYDNLTINIKKTMECPETTLQEVENIFNQSQYGFVLCNNTMQFSILSNGDKLGIEMNDIDTSRMCIWTKSTIAENQDIYTRLKQQLEKKMIVSSVETITINPLNQWAYYDCVRTIYHNLLK